MPRMKGQVRIPKRDFFGGFGKAYRTRVGGEIINFPQSITTVKINGEVVDLTVDLWFCKQNHIDTIAEWDE